MTHDTGARVGLCWVALVGLMACGGQVAPDEFMDRTSPRAEGDPPDAPPITPVDPVPAMAGSGGGGSPPGMIVDAPGDGDGNGELTQAEPDYFPMRDGARWVYRHEGGTRWDEEITMRAVDYDGSQAMEVRDTPGPSGSHSVSIYQRNGSRVLRVHKETFFGSRLDSLVDYSPGFARFDDAWTSMTVGASETLDYQRVETDPAGVVASDSLRSHRYELVSADERVTVPAGTFLACLHIRRERVRAPGVAAGAGDLKDFWFCPEVGKVKELDQTDGKTESLLSCSLPACMGG